MEQPSLEVDTLLQRQLLALVHRLLRSDNSGPAVAGDRLGGLDRLREQLVLAAVDHLRGETPLTGLLAAEVLARQDQLHGLALADRAGQALRTAGAGDHAQLDLRLAKGGAGGAVDDVAHHGQLAAAAEGVAGDGGDDGLADVVREVGPVGDEVIVVGRGEGQRGHLLDVGTGCRRGKKERLLEKQI